MPVPVEVLAEPKVDSGGVVRPEDEPVAFFVLEQVAVSLFYFFVVFVPFLNGGFS